MIASDGEESCAAPVTHHIHPEELLIEINRFSDVCNFQMNVTNLCTVLERVQTVVGDCGDFCQEGVNVEWLSSHLHFSILVELPFASRSVSVDLDSVSFRVGEVECFAHKMVGIAIKDYTSISQRQIRGCQTFPAWQENGVVIETSGVSRRLLCSGIMLEDQQWFERFFAWMKFHVVIINTFHPKAGILHIEIHHRLKISDYKRYRSQCQIHF